jgi:hypothetical protein
LPASLLRPDALNQRDGVVAGFTTRHGGASTAPYDAFNLGLHTDDDPAAVRENRRRLAAAFGMTPDRLATAGQVHGTAVHLVDAPGHVPDCDGLVTTAPEVLLCISAADCAAVLLADSAASVVGACHAGWRGAAGGIVAATVEQMVAHGAEPDRLRGYVSPCISANRFEVGPEVAAQFADAVVDHPPDADKPHVDLKAAIVRQLHAAGVPAPQIDVSPHCTMTETDTFFSHRGEDGVTGRMMGCIGLRG